MGVRTLDCIVIWLSITKKKTGYDVTVSPLYMRFCPGSEECKWNKLGSVYWHRAHGRLQMSSAHECCGGLPSISTDHCACLHTVSNKVHQWTLWCNGSASDSISEEFVVKSHWGSTTFLLILMFENFFLTPNYLKKKKKSKPRVWKIFLKIQLHAKKKKKERQIKKPKQKAKWNLDN